MTPGAEIANFVTAWGGCKALQTALTHRRAAACRPLEVVSITLGRIARLEAAEGRIRRHSPRRFFTRAGKQSKPTVAPSGVSLPETGHSTNRHRGNDSYPLAGLNQRRRPAPPWSLNLVLHGELSLALFNRKELVLGIDISSSAVKLMEISRSGQRFRVEAMAFEPLPEGSMEDRNPVDIDQVSAAIKRAVKTSGTRLKQAAVAVPTSSVIIRTIPMPLEFSEEEIEVNIQLDASQYIPFPLEEIYMDFQVVPGSAKKATGTQDVMLVASRQENVELRRDVLQEAGLQAAIVDVEAYALENTFNLLPPPWLASGQEQNAGAQDKHQLVGLVDLGAAVTTLYVIQNNKVIFSREQNFGGRQLTGAIAETYQMTKEQAEVAKRHSEQLPSNYANILDAYQQTAADQINQALQFFYSSDQFHSESPKLAGIFLTGGGVITPGIDQVISHHVGMPVTVGNPFVRMSSAPRVNRHMLLRDAPLFAIACGLALRSA